MKLSFILGFVQTITGTHPRNSEDMCDLQGMIA